MDETTHLSAAQVAERLGISLRTVRRRIADGTLPSLKVGGAVRIPAPALAIPNTADADQLRAATAQGLLALTINDVGSPDT
jgi:excisionase family DNA binding protein